MSFFRSGNCGVGGWCRRRPPKGGAGWFFKGLVKEGDRCGGGGINSYTMPMSDEVGTRLRMYAVRLTVVSSDIVGLPCQSNVRTSNSVKEIVHTEFSCGFLTISVGRTE